MITDESDFKVLLTTILYLLRHGGDNGKAVVIRMIRDELGVK